MVMCCVRSVGDAAAYRHTLKKTNIKPQFIPFHRRPLDANKRKGDVGLPLLRAVQDQVVERVADLAVITTTHS